MFSRAVPCPCCSTARGLRGVSQPVLLLHPALTSRRLHASQTVAHGKGKRRRIRKPGGSSTGDADEAAGATHGSDAAAAAEGLWGANYDEGYEEDDIILITASDDESSDEGDRDALRRFVQVGGNEWWW